MSDEAAQYAGDFASFILASPTSYHAAAEISVRLSEAGFVEHSEEDAWHASPGGHFLRRGGAVVAWKIPEGASTRSAFAIVGAHTDSPGFKLKMEPDSFNLGFSQVNVETYGGLLSNSWINRELGLAGRLVTLDGTEHLVRTDPIMVIPQLAPHLDRGVNTNGLILNPQRHLHPIWALGEASIYEYLAQCAQIEADQIAGTDIYAYDSQPPQVVSGNFFAAGRQDNLTSVHAGLCAFIEVESEDIAIFAAFDHEEVGSATTTGASGPILESVLRRTVAALGGGEDEYWQMLARSSCVSSDAGHSINPNYPEFHDPDAYPVLGSGPMVKINANQRYASDAHGEALWLRAAGEVGVQVQSFVSNNAVTCGSTIGPLSATRLGIDTVDVGVPLLSMHSARELSEINDLVSLYQILKGYWSLA